MEGPSAAGREPPGIQPGTRDRERALRGPLRSGTCPGRGKPRSARKKQLLAADDEQRSADRRLLQAGQVRLQEQEALVRDARNQRDGGGTRSCRMPSRPRPGRSARYAVAGGTHPLHPAAADRRGPPRSARRRSRPVRTRPRSDVTDAWRKSATAARARAPGRWKLAARIRAPPTKRIAAAQKELAGADRCSPPRRKPNPAALQARGPAPAQRSRARVLRRARRRSCAAWISRSFSSRPIVGVLGARYRGGSAFHPGGRGSPGPHLQAILLRDEEVAAALLGKPRHGQEARPRHAGDQSDALAERTSGESSPLPDGAIAWARGRGESPGRRRAAGASGCLASGVIVETLRAAQTLRRVASGSERRHAHRRMAWPRRLLAAGGQSGGECRATGRAPTAGADQDAGRRSRRWPARKSTAATDASSRCRRAVRRPPPPRWRMRARSLQTAQVQASTLQSQVGAARTRGARNRRQARQPAPRAGRDRAPLPGRRRAGRTPWKRMDQTPPPRSNATRRERADRRRESKVPRAGRITPHRNAQRTPRARRHRTAAPRGTAPPAPADGRPPRRTGRADRAPPRASCEEHRRRIERFDGGGRRARRRIEAARAELAEGEEQIATRHEEHADAADAVETLDADLRAQRQELTGWHDRRASQEIRETQLRLRQENLHEQTAQRYQIDLKLFHPEPHAFQQVYQPR